MQADGRWPVCLFHVIPAIMHPFRYGYGENREKPAIMHPFEAISALLDGKAENTCIIAGIFIFHPISLKKPALLQAFRNQ
ncbi:hypothetical protein BC351_38095 [Paenibacillus ferrarius]|uniref:Uncharacterized protein n=2 Tax=Paenibacillus ferrarius TaxID=1469647 RepID=A0A1V4HBL8_9BACL|nr:hypothetical protein BC351_38095 [Paenibacillus ferrarius]